MGKFKNIKRIVFNAILLQALQMWALPVSAADTTVVFTDYLPAITEETNAESGFQHPGIGLNKKLLDNVRNKVRNKIEPWNTYFNAMLESSAASVSVTSSNQSSLDTSKPGTYAFNSQGVNSKFISDALKAYTQAILYYVTGNETYRSNAMHIIRIWSQMDPDQYEYFADACIHTGIPLNRMTIAAEILRYTSCETQALEWTSDDTDNFINHLINPVIETFQSDQNQFMNQHNYTVLGAMSGYLFADNLEGYEKTVEWFTVNATANDQGYSGSIKQLFRYIDTEAEIGQKVSDGTLVEGHVQHVEMGRDQAHAGGDLTNSVILSRMLLAQGTKVDPVNGTVSTAANAVGPYEFLEDRILAAADYFWQYMLGYDTAWTKVAYSIASDETVKDTYNYISPSYRGRFNTANFWDLYSYYTYVKGEDVAKKAPYYYEAFTKKLPSNFYYEGSLNINWNNVDGGGDFWLYLPDEAEEDAALFLGKEQTSPYIIEIEDRYTAFDENSCTKSDEDGTSYVRLTATKGGSKIALLNASTSNKTVGFMIRTNGTAMLEMSPGINDTLVIPDTSNEWRYVAYTMDDNQSLGDILYLKVIGNATTVDLDFLNVNAGALLTPPTFTAGDTEVKLIAYKDSLIRFDFTATDSSSSDSIIYEGYDIPDLSELNTDSGCFTWTPTKAGTYSFVIAASDKTTVTANNVTITVANDRSLAVQEATALYDSDKIYVEASLKNYQTEYSNTIALMESDSDEEFSQQLQKLYTAANNLELVTPLLESDKSIDYPDIVESSTFSTSITNMVDGNPGTGVSYLFAPSKYHILDFGPDYKVSATGFGFQSNIFADRLAGSAVFGSNDKTTWTRLTPELTAFTQDFQTLDVADEYKNFSYRYIKIQLLNNYPDVIHNSTQNLFELSEFRIYGQRYEIGNKIESVSIGSDQSVSSKVSLGDTIKLTIKATEAIQNLSVQIQGQDAIVSSEDNIHWLAEAVMGDVPTGEVSFSIDYEKADGSKGNTVYQTTDDSYLFLVDGSKLLDVNLLASVTASDVQWPGTGLSADKVGYLIFDGDITTYGDLNTSSGSYYTIDFKEGKSVDLSEIVLMPRAGYDTRLNGLIIQGSNDNETWTNLTNKVTDAQEGIWYDIQYDDLLKHESYRYIRIYNDASWNGNVSEVEFYGDYNKE
ncbi:discoidin domain-containing protein [Lachnotalea glycerini]|uniref:F5/8 type C domain-containing protein n=1 Tax=Lachnotalea glycerini TaxID=1763509 RepID=A0A371JH61_9FIRM|nr:discoidin domain-containing protein [Lachnotalea glycerini]RDY32075.1 hypothetical protein CG710_006285 [Lachnotalea glycerini]